MPKIPTYEQQVISGRSVSATTGSLSLNLADTGTGESLSRLGENLRKVVGRRRKQNAVAWATKTLADAELQWTEHLENAKKQADPGAAGFSRKFLEEYGKYAEETAKNAPEEVRPEVQNGLLRLRNRLAGYAIKYEARESRAYRLDSLAQAVDSRAKVVMADPSAFAENLQDQLAAIDALDEEPDIKRDFIDKTKAALAKSAMLGLMQSDPEAALRELDAGDKSNFSPIKYLTADQLITYKAAASKAAETARKDAEKRRLEAEKQLKDDTERLFMERLVAGNLSVAEVLSADNLTGDEQNKWIDRIGEQAKKGKEKQSDPDTLASFNLRAAGIGEPLTRGDISTAVRNGKITAKDGASLAGKIDQEITKNPQVKRAYKLLDNWRTKNLFSGNDKDNNLAWARASSALDSWIVDHPGEDPLPWLEEYLAPQKESLLDRLLGGLFGSDEPEGGGGGNTDLPPAQPGKTMYDAKTGKYYIEENGRWIERQP